MISEGYKVRLETFEGPLDLLLYLIRKSEVDIHNIPISQITEQYLGSLRDLTGDGLSKVDIDTAGEFIVMAATLMEIKSRMLFARPGTGHREAGPARDETDPRAELVRQLLEYKRYRDAAESLESRAEQWRRRFPTHPAGVDGEAIRSAVEAAQAVEMEDLDVIDLVEAFRRIAETVNFDRLGDHQVTYDDTPIEVHAEDILHHIATRAKEGEVEFSTIFMGRKRGEMIGLFLAILELVKQRRMRVRQCKDDGRIYLREPEGDAAPIVEVVNAPASAEQTN